MQTHKENRSKSIDPSRLSFTKSQTKSTVTDLNEIPETFKKILNYDNQQIEEVVIN
jgi:Asp-tRNA(Asn)/Glu-tRNA(Gln) amidotransferase C subunit